MLFYFLFFLCSGKSRIATALTSRASDVRELPSLLPFVCFVSLSKVDEVAHILLPIYYLLRIVYTTCRRTS